MTFTCLLIRFLCLFFSASLTLFTLHGSLQSFDFSLFLIVVVGFTVVRQQHHGHKHTDSLVSLSFSLSLVQCFFFYRK